MNDVELYEKQFGLQTKEQFASKLKQLIFKNVKNEKIISSQKSKITSQTNIIGEQLSTTISNTGVDSETIQGSFDLIKPLMSTNTSNSLYHTIYTILSHFHCVKSMSGITSFTMISPVSNNCGTVILNTNNGIFSIDVSILSPNNINTQILAGMEFTLSNLTSTINFINISQVPITSPTDLVNYLNNNLPLNIPVNIDITSNINLLQNKLKSDVNLVQVILSLLRSIANNPTNLYDDFNNVRQLVTTPNLTFENDISTLIGYIKMNTGSIKSAVDALSNLIVGNASYSQSLYNNTKTILNNFHCIQSMSGLTSFTVTTLATNNNGVVSLTVNDGSMGQIYSLDTGSLNLIGTPIVSGSTFTLTNNSSGNIITFINISNNPITSANSMITYLNNYLILNVSYKVNLNDNISTVRNMIMNLPGVTIQSDLNSIISDIDSNATNVKSGLDNISNLIFGNSNYSTPLYNQTVAISNDIDNSVISLPNGSTYVTVGNIYSDNTGVNITITSGLGSSNGIYNNPANIPINKDSSITFTNGNNKIVLKNLSSSIINENINLLKYLKSMYPVDSKLSLNVNDKMTSIKTMLGTTGTTFISSISTIDKFLLVNPTGVLLTDLNSARGKLILSNNSTLEEDITDIKDKILQTSTGNPLETDIITLNQEILNTPSGVLETDLTIARSKLVIQPGITLETDIDIISNILSGSIVTTGNSIESIIGDPISGTTGLSSLIKNNTLASNINTVFTGVSDFNNASNLHDQLSQFIQLFNSLNWNNSNHTSITFTFTSSPTSLTDIINAATSTS
jgi:hypothetical protein